MGRLETITHVDWHLALYGYSLTLGLVWLSPAFHPRIWLIIRCLFIRLPSWALLYPFLTAVKISLRRVLVFFLVVLLILRLQFRLPRAGYGINTTTISLMDQLRFLRAGES